MSPSQGPYSGSFAQARPPSPVPSSPAPASRAPASPAPASAAPTSPRTRYAPDPHAVAADLHITDADVLAVIEARGGQAYSASVDTGLANRFPFVDATERKKAVERALKSGALVKTPMGVFRRPPKHDE